MEKEKRKIRKGEGVEKENVERRGGVEREGEEG